MSNEVTKLVKQTFRNSLSKIVQESAELLPKHMTPERMLKLVYAAATRNPKLFECTPASIGMCLTTCSELGLEPGVERGHIYLIPRWNGKSKTNECTLQIGYKGYCELGRRSGEIAVIDATVVYNGEHFTVSRGLNPDLQHDWRHDIDRSDTAIVAAYAFVRLKNGQTIFEVLTRREIDAHRSRSPAGKNGPWVTDYARMARKTAIRALFSGGLVPMSAELSIAVQADLHAEIIDVEPIQNQPQGASESLRALAQAAVALPDKSDDIRDPVVVEAGDPLEQLYDELNAATDVKQVLPIREAWVKASEEGIHPEIKKACTDRMKAIREEEKAE